VFQVLETLAKKCFAHRFASPEISVSVAGPQQGGAVQESNCNSEKKRQQKMQNRRLNRQFDLERTSPEGVSGLFTPAMRGG
jgi:hypothetical protein